MSHPSVPDRRQILGGGDDAHAKTLLSLRIEIIAKAQTVVRDRQAQASAITAALDLDRAALSFPIGMLGGVQRQLVDDDTDLLGHLAAHRQRFGLDRAASPVLSAMAGHSSSRNAESSTQPSTSWT
jgi:hypothetical protein